MNSPDPFALRLTLFASVLTAISFALLFWQNNRYHKLHGVVFPPLDPKDVRFRETGASGCSHKTALTRFGGASRCLEVTVTAAEVWVRMGFPLNVLALRLDLEHRIPRASIVSAQAQHTGWRRSVLLDYRDEHGGVRRLSLRLRNPDAFLHALKPEPPVIEAAQPPVIRT